MTDEYHNMPTMTENSGETVRQLGVMMVPNGLGMATPCLQTAELKTAHVIETGKPPVVIICVLDLEMGLYVAMSPADARAAAAAMLRSADDADGGYGEMKQ